MRRRSKQFAIGAAAATLLALTGGYAASAASASDRCAEPVHRCRRRCPRLVGADDQHDEPAATTRATTRSPAMTAATTPSPAMTAATTPSPATTAATTPSPAMTAATTRSPATTTAGTPSPATTTTAAAAGGDNSGPGSSHGIGRRQRLPTTAAGRDRPGPAPYRATTVSDDRDGQPGRPAQADPRPTLAPPWQGRVAIRRSSAPVASAIRRTMSSPRPVEPAELRPRPSWSAAAVRTVVRHDQLDQVPVSGAPRRRSPIPVAVCANTLSSNTSTASTRSCGSAAI